jgi:23S rRNA (adenine2030-N6)-methyltransferase
VNLPSPDGFGMHGSGLFILNPPWTLYAALQQALPWLVSALGGEGANYTLEKNEG